LDDVEKRKFLTLPGLEPRLLGRPTRNQSLYRLSYRGSLSSSNQRDVGKDEEERGCDIILSNNSGILLEGLRKSM
jgi:hypothetical protein